MTRNPHSEAVIRTQGLTKTFTRHKQTVEAVRGLDLEVQDGELVAFLGPNGAGKSTTLRMLTTLIPPTSGTAAVAGFDVVRQHRDVRRSIGYVGQGNAAGHQQRGRDEVVSQGRAHGLSRAQANARADELLEAFDLTEHARRPVSTLSGGQRRRLDVAIGLVHSPRLLFLDEPSTGLDPQNRINLQEQIQRLNREIGTTIVLTTHYLEEADAIADRVIVIDHGQVIADDSASRLKSGLGDLVSLGFASDSHVAAAAEKAARIASAIVQRVGSRRHDPGGARARPGARAGGRPGRGRHSGHPDGGRRPDPRRRLPRPDRPQLPREQRDHPDRETPSPKEQQHDHDRRDRPVAATPQTVAAQPKAPGFFGDTWNVMVRELKPVFREPASVLFAMVQPLVFLGLFAPLLPEGRARLGAAVVRAGHHRDDRADGRELHRRQPHPGDHERLPRAAARVAAQPQLADGRPVAQGGRADADADRDHRRGRDAVRLRPAPAAEC